MNLTSLWFSSHRGKPEITTVKQSLVRLQGFVVQYNTKASLAGRLHMVLHPSPRRTELHLDQRVFLHDVFFSNAAIHRKK